MIKQIKSERIKELNKKIKDAKGKKQFMVAIWYVEDGILHSHVHTEAFPLGLVRKATADLEASLLPKPTNGIDDLLGAD